MQTPMKDFIRALDTVPFCVDTEGIEDGDMDHLIFRVEHPVCLRQEGEDFYTAAEARKCRKWLRKWAPQSEYAR